MKTSLLLFFCLLLMYGRAQHLTSETAVSATWTNFSGSANIYGMIYTGPKPLQYNDELNVVSFIQRNPITYTVSPPLSVSLFTGIIIAMISSNWGQSWDSTCLWSDSTNWARYCQGAIYNPPGNTSINNAYVVGSGPVTNKFSDWSGNWYASRRLGAGNYNNAISSAPGAQQFFSSTTSAPSMGECNFSKNSFSSTDDGVVRSLADLGNLSGLQTTAGKGAMVVKGTFSSGIFHWSGDSILCPAAMSSSHKKSMGSEPRMAWNESGTVGYVMFIGSRSVAVLSNRGWQPIIFKTINSGASWYLIPAIDFNSPDAMPVKRHLPAVRHANQDSALILPMFNQDEGIDMIVDKSNRLHIACVLTGAVSQNIDSIGAGANYSYGSEQYTWPHTPGRHPYLYDFFGDGTGLWRYGIVDSLMTEAPGINQGKPGFDHNPWNADLSPDGTADVVACDSRIQLSRTPDGNYIVFTWAESDTNVTANKVKWNMYPNVKARLLDATSGLLSDSKLSLTSGDANLDGLATMHFISPKSSPASVGSKIRLTLPVTVSTNAQHHMLEPAKHWFSAVDLEFATSMHTFATSIGTNENAELASVSVYPNPAEESLMIEFATLVNSGVIELFNSMGQLLYANSFVKQRQEINTGDLSSGLYYLKVKHESDQKVFKVIKK